MGLVAVHLAGDLACVEAEPKPWVVRWDLVAEEGRVLEVEGPAGGVGDPEEAHNLEEEGREVGVPLEAGQIDQGRALGEEACRHDLEGH